MQGCESSSFSADFLIFENSLVPKFQLFLWFQPIFVIFTQFHAVFPCFLPVASHIPENDLSKHPGCLLEWIQYIQINNSECFTSSGLTFFLIFFVYGFAVCLKDVKPWICFAHNFSQPISIFPHTTCFCTSVHLLATHLFMRLHMWDIIFPHLIKGLWPKIHTQNLYNLFHRICFCFAFCFVLCELNIYKYIGVAYAQISTVKQAPAFSYKIDILRRLSCMHFAHRP